MSKVIAVQEAQLKMIRENYDKNIPGVSVVKEENVVNPSVPSAPLIDMESQIVNLNSEYASSEPTVTNINATTEVFGVPSSNSIQKTEEPVSTVSPVVQPFSNEASSEVPYKEPLVSDSVPVNVLSDDSYFELLNSLRNMITDFANNAYAAIDKFQEERLQGKVTGANLVGEALSNGINSVNDVKTEESVISPVSNVAAPAVSNIFDNQTVDLDNTVVLPADFIANNISETENELKMSA